MIYLRPIVFLVLLSAVGAVLADTDASLDDALRVCASLESEHERLACFDALSRGTASDAETAGAPKSDKTVPPANDPGPQAENAVPAAGTAARPLTDDVGRGQVDGADAPESEKYGARLTRCEVSGPSERTYFFLDNGQVWRQSTSDRLRLRDCDTEVEITKDFFGFKLLIPAQNRTVRVRRVR